MDEVPIAKKEDLLPSTMLGEAVTEEIKKLQAADPDIGPVLQENVSGKKI